MLHTSIGRTDEGDTRTRRGTDELRHLAGILSPSTSGTSIHNSLPYTKSEALEGIERAIQNTERLAGIGKLTAHVAQELSSPIGFITASCANLLEALASGQIDHQQLIRSIELIERSAYQSAGILEVLGKYTDGGDGSGMAITSPAALLQDALALVEEQFLADNVQVLADLEPGLSTLFCDHNRIAQVLITLLFNAHDALQPGGGTVLVRFWTPNPADDIMPPQVWELNGKADQDGRRTDLFAFQVSDRGSGIDLHNRGRIFEPFFTTKHADQGGTGLGLYVARQIVTEHGGCMWFEDNPGGGTRFIVVLPRRP